MERKKLNRLVEEIQREYQTAKSDFIDSGMFSSAVHASRMSLCERIINKINEIYKNKYQVNGG